MKKKNHKILWVLDRAHGENVQGKQSPDGSFIEWEYSTKVVEHLLGYLSGLGIESELTTIDQREIGLSKRSAIANKYVESGKYDYVFLLSPHNNASVKPNTGTGNEVFIAPSSNDEELQERDRLNKIIGNVFGNLIEKKFSSIFKFRRHNPDIVYKEAPFTVLQGTKSKPAKYSGILIEFGFMDNDHDLKYLKDKRVFKDYVETLAYAIYGINATIGYKDFIVVDNFKEYFGELKF